jgi:hypothetical protein
MIFPDANILIYAVNDLAKEHEPAHKWLTKVLESEDVCCFSWPTITAFLRVVTNPRVFPRPTDYAKAFDVMEYWLDQPGSIVLKPGGRFMPIFRELVIAGQARGNLLMDAHLAALAIEHGATLATTDRDFTRFPGLKMMNPLQP